MGRWRGGEKLFCRCPRMTPIRALQFCVASWQQGLLWILATTLRVEEKKE